jgi:AraC-like DNA-binding protein
VEDTKHRKASVRSRRSLAQGVVRVGPLMGVPAVLCELGQEPGPIFDSAGLQPAQFADADHEISYVAASRLLARCVAATGCQHFGLLVGKRADPSSLGVAGFMLRSAPDVGTALRGLVQHLDLHDQGGVPTLLIKGSLTLLGYAIHQSGTEATDQIYDLSVAIGCNIMRGLCGESWKPTEILLSRRPPLDLEPYRKFFRAPLHFNAEQSAVVFPSRWLDHQITTADPLLHRHLEKQASELQALRHASITGDLRGLLRKSLLAHKCTASDVARQLCIHERTLNRKLQQQGTSFRRALDDTRCEMARQLLADSAMPLAKIANTLNYADASAFSRAFKRWMGVTPAQWRTQNASSP